MPNYNPHQPNGWFGKGKQYSSSDLALSRNRHLDKTGFGFRDNDTKITYATEQESDEARRELQMEYQRSEAARRNKEEKERDKEKRKPKKSFKINKPKPVKTNYKLGDTIKIDGKEYTVGAIDNSDSRYPGYIVKDNKGNVYTIDKYGKIHKGSK